MKIPFRRLTILAASLILLALAGCGGATYKVAEVEGILHVNGKPAHKMRIEFQPMIDKQTKGPMSMANTDAQGNFTLHLMEGPGESPRTGAVVGWHRVVLSDLQLAESETGKGVPRRLKEEYTRISSTTLTREVTNEPKQRIKIELSYP